MFAKLVAVSLLTLASSQLMAAECKVDVDKAAEQAPPLVGEAIGALLRGAPQRLFAVLCNASHAVSIGVVQRRWYGLHAVREAAMFRRILLGVVLGLSLFACVPYYVEPGYYRTDVYAVPGPYYYGGYPYYGGGYRPHYYYRPYYHGGYGPHYYGGYRRWHH